MIFNWDDFIKLANRLMKLEKPDANEAYYRTIINRYYYGSFCIAFDYLSERNRLDDKTISKHKNVIETLIKSANRNEYEIGINLKRLRKLRVDADYLCQKTLTSNDAVDAYQYSNKIINSFRNLLL